MSLAITDEHLELERAVRSFLNGHGAYSESRRQLDAPDEQLPGFWASLCDLGWLGLHIPEPLGGSGYGLPESAIVLEELGRSLAPGPFLSTVIASAVIAATGSQSQKARWLPSLADGSKCAAVGLHGTFSLVDGFLDGSATLVLGAGIADLLVLTSGDDVFVLDAAGAGIAIVPSDSLDPTRPVGLVNVEHAVVGPGTVISGAAATALALSRVLAAAEASGIARGALEMAVSYAKVRHQFGRPIGSFQAVKHHCANMLVSAELATASVWDACRTGEIGGEQLSFAAAVAASTALPAAVNNAKLNIQVHGGVGFTWEHAAHLLLRRAASLAALFGSDASDHVASLTEAGVTRPAALDLPAESELIRAEVRGLVERWRTLEPTAVRRELIETGYVQPHWPKPWGRGAGAVEQLVIDEELEGVDRPSYGIGTWILLTLIQHGTEGQIRRWIRPSLDGQLVWCQLFSEPEAGSDAAAIRTKGLRAEGGWRVTGQKVWTTGAQFCNRGFATVRTDPDAEKHRGITMMVIDLEETGVEVRPLREATGEALFNEVFLDDVFVPDDDVVGPVNGGWTVARSTLGNERVSIGSGMFGNDLGIDLIGLAHRSFGGSTRLVGALLAERRSMELLNLRSAARAVAGSGPGPEGNITKLLSAEHVQRTAELAFEMAGPVAALLNDEHGVYGRALLATRGHTIAGGTSEITRNQIAERILGLPREQIGQN